MGFVVRHLSFCLGAAGWLAPANGAVSEASPRWELASEAGRKIGVAVAVCQPGEDPVCIGLGCKATDGFEFVEMITGGWLNGSTRISAGSNSTTIELSRDMEGSAFMNIPVSRGAIDDAFLSGIAEEETLQVESSLWQYSATFPLSGFEKALKMAPSVCAELRSDAPNQNRD